ncbi:mucin-5AC-like [Leptodactylus fuscus]
MGGMLTQTYDFRSQTLTTDVTSVVDTSSLEEEWLLEHWQGTFALSLYNNSHRMTDADGAPFICTEHNDEGARNNDVITPGAPHITTGTQSQAPAVKPEARWLNAYLAELVVSSDNDEYLYNRQYGFVGLRSISDPSQYASLQSRKIISLGIDFNKVCSYWSNFHYKTFNDRVFYFPGTCSYVFASHCKNNYEDFVIHIKHEVDENNDVLYTNVTLKIDDIKIQLTEECVLVQDEIVDTPYGISTIMIQDVGLYIQITSSVGLMFRKYEDGSFELQLDSKYANQTCGLCGNLMGKSIFDLYDVPLTATEYGNLQKADGPNENCPDASPPDWSDCFMENETICETTLNSLSFSNCHEVLDTEQYIKVCRQDLCRCTTDVESCICATITQYSHQCILHRGQPQDWRRLDFCYKSCEHSMSYHECGSSCMDTCSDPERELTCDQHCVAGCYCPEGILDFNMHFIIFTGLIYDDVGNFECILPSDCPCSYNGNVYQPGESYSTSCRTCSCYGGRWNCTVIPCSETCSIEGGSHITTFDQLRYNVRGDCYYVISKDCLKSRFTILGELRQCGIRHTEACLKGVIIYLNNATTKLEIRSSGLIYVNGMKTSLPVYTEKYIVFQPSPFYIVAEPTTIEFQVVVQILPTMQLYVVLEPSFRTVTCGLCGNFNNIQKDDLRTISGIIEGSAAAFVNTWKMSSNCPNIQDTFDDPCTLSVETAEYAKHWCGLLVNRTGIFSPCHNLVDPYMYYKNCLTDTCSCDNSEDCMCAALFSYYKICAAKGIILTDWQTVVCNRFTTYCPKSQLYSYQISSCLHTCHSLSEPDVLCKVHFDPLVGCNCPHGFYLNESGICIPVSTCPCYYKGNEVLSGHSITDNGVICYCNRGKLSCIDPAHTECKSPMTFASCNSFTEDIGIECAKSCHTLDMDCYATKCIPGCVCPPGLISDDKGGCIYEDDCPCIHNGAMYKTGTTIQVKCNTCVCEKRKWECTNNTCLATCTVYGDGHFITFDGKIYNFNGECQYTLTQDHCSPNDNSSLFRIVTENVPCGTTGVTCSKSIKIFMKNYELILDDDRLNVAQKGEGTSVPYRVRLTGIFLVVETDCGILLLWDKKTTIFIKVTSDFQGKLCGLCGNYDGNANNDYTTRNNAIVGNIEEFANSWKSQPSCPDVTSHRDPCSLNPYRVSWAQKQCSIITSEVFAACHTQVDPFKYYDSCVTDSCACNTGGDCECFCTAVAAYAQACGEFGICIAWRTPDICPLFCDYYNEDDGCEWHYKPCGVPCLLTCRNPNGTCNYPIRGLEGCYPNCPPERPYFDEDEMKCTAICGCLDEDRKYYKLGTLFSNGENCIVCNCTEDGIVCFYDVRACVCVYEGRVYKYNETVYDIVSETEGCVIGICKENGTIERNVYDCPTTTQTTYTTISETSHTTTPSTSTGSVTTTTSPITPFSVSRTTNKTIGPVTCTPNCYRTGWIDGHKPTSGDDGGEYESLKACTVPVEIECRVKEGTVIKENQTIICNLQFGLVCLNSQQASKQCYDYEIRSNYFCSYG